ncbi:MAG: ABC transporter substrate-binding protein [Cylindrospermopsis raciborskii KL1]|jgi:NitT/TauT family transport system substrate-binding protein|uniref:ABC transporter substrate-binding protein n=1 Tax=Cylindrospermopsis raciborskii TaxID=77022 RepID=UPI001A31110E|nr:ABC transporter substrate-binding protein [Cylindrospermopsis raciborskii]MBG0741956.1 ABC transporter substrate-binding protein [Cylindrospermopsis raciborskii KL1]
MRKLLCLCTLFIFSLLLAISCTPYSGDSREIQVGFSVWPGWLPWQIAANENLFTANNIQVNLKWFDGYLDSINALNSGKLDANSQTLNDTISSVAAGADQVIVLVNDNSTGNDKIIVREGINTIADLKGKKVAVEEGTVDHFLLLLGMKKAGLTSNDIILQPLETGAASAAFVAGQVDAVGVFAPFTTKALELPGSKELFSSRDFPGAIPDHLVVNRQLIKERPQDVQALVNTWFETLDYIKANPEKSNEIMAKRAGVTVDEYKKYAEGTKIFSVEDNLQAFSSNSNIVSLKYTAQEIAEFLVEAKLAKKVPDLSQIFDDRFVKAYAAKQK